MAKRSETAEALVDAIGFDATMRLVAVLGGKVIKIPNGLGKAGAFCALLDEVLGTEPARCLKLRFGGEKMHVPMMTDQVKAARNRLIVADYDSQMVMLALVRKYSLSERQIRTILNSPPAEETALRRVVDDRQLGLF